MISLSLLLIPSRQVTANNRTQSWYNCGNCILMDSSIDGRIERKEIDGS